MVQTIYILEIISFLLLAFVFIMTEEPQKMIAKTNNEFSFKIFRMLSKDENDVMSSLSILSALSILMNGAKGETLLDMKGFSDFKNCLSDEKCINEGFQKITERYQNHQLNMANLVIHDKQVKLESVFKEVVEQYFKGEVQSADFKNNGIEENNKINDWVRNKTNNKIQKVFDQLEKDTAIVIVNVLYFRGIWKQIFEGKKTKKMNFYNNGVTAVKVDTMNNEEMFMYTESSELDSQVLEMDYFGGEISFIVVLPKKRNALNSLKNKINAQNLERALKSMETWPIDVYLPKFRIEKSYDLMKAINPKLLALTPSADLSRLYSGPEVVHKIIHKVFIDVNEEGTEAAAVTGIEINLCGKPFEGTVQFKAEHPFLYFIRDKTNSIILFSGQLNKF